MKSTLDISNNFQNADGDQLAVGLAAQLESDGIVMLPNLVSAERFRSMQQAFETRLRRLRWNNFEGYQKTERYRHMVEDLLLLDQGFVEVGIHPLIKKVLSRYLGQQYALTEAKGWKSLPTKRDFHGWHGDAWYEQGATLEIPKEVKMAMYLTDVRSGAFNYIRGSHRKQHPRPVRNHEVENVSDSQITEMKGLAGTAFLFDTSGIHRQGVPMLEERRAIFYNYHDPGVRLQKEDLVYYRYHPLLLNSAFLSNLSDDDQRILGFGDKRNFLPGFERSSEPPRLYTVFQTVFDAQIFLTDLVGRINSRLKRIFN